MNKKRGILLIGLFLLVIMSLGVSAANTIPCTEGAKVPGTYSTSTCTVSSNLGEVLIDTGTATLKTWEFEKLEVGSGTNLHFVNTYAYVSSNSLNGQDGNCQNTCDAYGTPQVGGGGGAGGFGEDGESAATREGDGGEGGAGGELFYNGGSGGDGGIGRNWVANVAGGSGGSSPTYAGANIKLILNELILNGDLSVSGTSGTNGGRGTDVSGIASGGGGGAGGSGAGRIHLLAVTVLGLGEIYAEGGAGTKGGGGGVEGKDNDEDGCMGGGGGGGVGGEIILELPSGTSIPTNNDGGDFGAKGDQNDCKNEGENGVSGANGPNVDTDLQFSENTLLLCNNGIDNDYDLLRDMQDEDCYATSAVCPTRLTTDYTFYENLIYGEYNSRNTDDLCCGDDKVPCLGKDIMDNGACEDYWTEDACTANIKCSWKDASDVGSIKEVTEGSVSRVYRCDSSWNLLLAEVSIYDIKRIIRGVPEAIVVEQISNGDTWYSCDAHGQNLLGITGGSLLGLGESPLPAGAGDTQYNDFICYGYNYANGYVHSHAEFAECDEDSLGKSIFNIPSEAVSEQLELTNPAYVVDVSKITDWSHDGDNTYDKLYFNYKSDKDLDKVEIYRDGDGKVPSYVFDNPVLILEKSSEEWSTYILNLDNSIFNDFTNVESIVFYPSEYPANVDVQYVELSVPNLEMKYCSKDSSGNYQWVGDLDSLGGQSACEERYSGWTGVSCCGDDTTSTSKEYYTVTGEGENLGCYLGVTVLEGKSVFKVTKNEEDRKVLVHKDETDDLTKFYGCGSLPTTGPLLDGQDITGITESFISGENCPSLAGYLCENGNWYGYDEEMMEGALIDGGVPESYGLSSDYEETESHCCPNGGCWMIGEGEEISKCVAESTSIEREDLVCYRNRWVNTEDAKKWNPYRNVGGTCLEDNYCFIDRDLRDYDLDEDGIFDDVDLCPRTPLNLKDDVEANGCEEGEKQTETILTVREEGGESDYCVPSNYFIDVESAGNKIDAYCHDGNWITRTALIAASLEGYANDEGIDDYSLFCDDAIIAGNGVSSYDELNNMCVLRYEGTEEERVLGIPFNKDEYYNIEDFRNNFLNNIIFKDVDGDYRTFCDNVLADKYLDKYYPCDNDDQLSVWLNPYTYSLIVTKYNGGFNPLEWDDWTTVFQNVVSDPINIILDLINGNTGDEDPMFSESNMEILPAQRFDKLYINKLGVKSIKGYFLDVYENDNSPVTIEYNNVSQDICEITDTIKMGAVDSGKFHCNYVPKEVGWSFYVLSPLLTDLDYRDKLSDIWTDLTSEIRLKPGGSIPLVVQIITEDPLILGEEIIFEAESTLGDLTGSTYEWHSLVDDELVTSVDTQFTISISNPGTYDIHLKLTTSDDEVKTVIKTITVNTPPTASSLLISPDSPIEGVSLIATYIYEDEDDDEESGSIIKWYSSVDEEGDSFELVEGETGDELDSSIPGMYYKFSVIPKNLVSEGTERFSDSKRVMCDTDSDLIDFECVSITECNDGIDNDEDSTCDYGGCDGMPGDEGCSSEEDTSEAECGNQVIELGEQCDDGYADNTDTVCVANYGSSCTYCDTNCESQTIVGDYCGDEIVNGYEVCDDSNCKDDCTACINQDYYLENNICIENDVVMGTCENIEGNDCSDFIGGCPAVCSSQSCVVNGDYDCNDYTTFDPGDGYPEGCDQEGQENGCEFSYPQCSAPACISVNNCPESACALESVCSGSFDCSNVFDESECNILSDVCYWDEEGSSTSLCGNNVLNEGEVCDDANCNSVCTGCNSGYSPNQDGVCILDDIGILCGNNRVDQGEQCDGLDFGPDDCRTLGWMDGRLACYSDCTFDTSDCSE